MDPISITASCLAIVGAITKTSTTITGFVRTFSDARRDLTGISGLLTQLRMTLDLLGGQNEESPEAIPESVQESILSIISNCDEIMKELDGVMDKHRGKSGSMKWAFSGKEKVEGLSKQLDAHIAALDIALEVSTLAIARSIKRDTASLVQTSGQIKQDTTALLEGTAEVKEDTARILEEIERLKSMIISPPSKMGSPLDHGMKEYLDSMTNYTVNIREDADTEAKRKVILPQAPQSIPQSAQSSPGSPTLLADASIRWSSALFVPGKDLLAVCSKGKCTFYTLPTWKVWKTLDLNRILVHVPRIFSFSPDGSLLSAVGNNAGFGIYINEIPALDQPTVCRISEVDMEKFDISNYYRDVQFSQDNSQMAVACASGWLEIFAAVGKMKTFSMRNKFQVGDPNIDLQYVGFSPNGRSVACVMYSKEPLEWRLAVHDSISGSRQHSFSLSTTQRHQASWPRNPQVWGDDWVIPVWRPYHTMKSGMPSAAGRDKMVVLDVLSGKPCRDFTDLDVSYVHRSNGASATAHHGDQYLIAVIRSFIVWGTGNVVDVWSARGRKFAIETQDSIWEVMLSNDLKYLVILKSDTSEIWEVP